VGSRLKKPLIDQYATCLSSRNVAATMQCCSSRQLLLLSMLLLLLLLLLLLQCGHVASWHLVMQRMTMNGQSSEWQLQHSCRSCIATVCATVRMNERQTLLSSTMRLISHAQPQLQLLLLLHLQLLVPLFLQLCLLLQLQPHCQIACIGHIWKRARMAHVLIRIMSCFRAAATATATATAAATTVTCHSYLATVPQAIKG